MSAPAIPHQDIGVLWAAWQSTMAEHDRIEDQRYELDQSAEFDFPMVQHGRCGRVYTRDEEIDSARRLSDATKARLKAKLAHLCAAYDAARNACGLTALEERVEALRLEADRLEDAIAATRSGTFEGVYAKLTIALRLATDCGYEGVSGMLRAAVADADALATRCGESEARELVWWALLHAAEGWVHASDETCISLDIDDGPKGLVVPLLPGEEILPDTASPLWPAAAVELRAARARSLAAGEVAA